MVAFFWYYIHALFTWLIIGFTHFIECLQVACIHVAKILLQCLHSLSYLLYSCWYCLCLETLVTMSNFSEQIHDWMSSMLEQVFHFLAKRYVQLHIHIHYLMSKKAVRLHIVRVCSRIFISSKWMKIQQNIATTSHNDGAGFTTYSYIALVFTEHLCSILCQQVAIGIGHAPAVHILVRKSVLCQNTFSN